MRFTFELYCYDGGADGFYGRTGQMGVMTIEAHSAGEAQRTVVQQLPGGWMFRHRPEFTDFPVGLRTSIHEKDLRILGWMMRG